jgi:hypothetical protein
MQFNIKLTLPSSRRWLGDSQASQRFRQGSCRSGHAPPGHSDDQREDAAFPSADRAGMNDVKLILEQPCTQRLASAVRLHWQRYR